MVFDTIYGTCWVERLDGVTINLQRRVGLHPSKAYHVVAIVVDLYERISNHVVRQTDVVHDEHAAVHLHGAPKNVSHRL